MGYSNGQDLSDFSSLINNPASETLFQVLLELGLEHPCAPD